ncbi:ribonucleoside-diphosphate reductase, adenosylcobalamin-dependent [Synechococcus virus S-ESS1]|uniref:Vitamin B12-dependent ribonucleotide reductase n=1 Tax=Synechococcus virus S-ESS1 TaxID=1964565 RepID=A0A1V0DX37_9CAUD|nr:ribonucleotide reductase [Synechococcus virus S-ESS1]ARB05724.1 ribonucleoside-diphosphate reductase, adenosylcobalamin-dependent [Synechococcus virus S-ESS1]
MDAVKNDAMWPLIHVEPPKESPELHEAKDHTGKTVYIHEVVSARDIWNAIMESTYKAAEPGVIFIDRINEENNLRYCETISATNPCGEQPLPPYGACLLGSINLAMLVENPFTNQAGIDHQKLRHLVSDAVRMMDNVIEVSNFPLVEQADEAFSKRRIGLGLTGLADALAMCKLRYGSPASAEKTRKWMKRIDEYAYWASVELAKEKGAFPVFNADEFLAEGTHASKHPEDLKDAIRQHGIRNALLTSIAPTGTISIYAGNVSSGIEPIFAYGYTRKVLQPDGTKTEEWVEDYAVSLYRQFWAGETQKGEEWFKPEEHLPDYFVTAQTLSPMEHVTMQAAAQAHVDSSISKTINCPEDISFEDFKEVYMAAYEMGCKGCTTYRPNDITGSVLSVDEKPKKEPEVVVESTQAPDTDWLRKAFEAGPQPYQEAVMASLTEETLPQRPEELNGSTYKIKVGDQKAVYLTINDMVESDGTVRPFEIFLRSSDPTHDEWMVALARMISAIMRRPHDSSFVGPELMRITSALTGGFQRNHGYQPSLVAAIGAKIKEHMDRENFVKARVEEWFQQPVGTPAMEGLKEAMGAGQPPSPNKPCPSCNSYNTKFESGCHTCLDCGQ